MLELARSLRWSDEGSIAQQFSASLQEFEVARGLRYEVSPVTSQRPGLLLIENLGSRKLPLILHELGLLDGQTLWCQAQANLEGGQMQYGWKVEKAFGPPSQKGVDGFSLSYNTDGNASIELVGGPQQIAPEIARIYRLMGELSENNSKHAAAMMIFRTLFLDAAAWTHNALRQRRLAYQYSS